MTCYYEVLTAKSIDVIPTEFHIKIANAHMFLIQMLEYDRQTKQNKTKQNAKKTKQKQKGKKRRRKKYTNKNAYFNLSIYSICVEKSF